MQTDKKRNLPKLAETLGLILVPLIIVLVLGLWFRSSTTQPVAQAKSVPTQSNTLSFSDDIPNASFDAVSANGIMFYAGNYRLSDNQLLADVCFDMIDNSDWIIWHSWGNHIVDTQGHEATIVSMSVIEILHPPMMVDGKLKQLSITTNNHKYKDAAPDQKIGQRCDTIRYTLPAGFDPSRFTITINSIGRNPDEADTCGADDTPYMKKIQAALDEKKTGIKIKSASSDGEGICGVRVAQKPSNMSQEAAQRIATSDEIFLDLFGIRGPWVFEGSIK